MQEFNKKWIRYEKYFKLELNTAAVGEMEILLKSKFPEHCVNMKIDGVHYYIKNTGPWQSTFTIYDFDMNIVLRSIHMNWNSKQYLIEYETELYEIRLEIGTQPTWHLLEKGKKLLSYSTDLQTNEILISEISERNIPIIFDFIQLYLILLK